MNSDFLKRYAILSMLTKNVSPGWSPVETLFFPDRAVVEMEDTQNAGFKTDKKTVTIPFNKEAKKEPEVYGLTYEGKFLEGSEVFDRIEDPVRIEKIGKYIVAYTFTSISADTSINFQRMEDSTEQHKEYKAITAYAIYSAKSLKPLKIRVMANRKRNICNRRTKRIADYPSLMAFDRDSKAFYTYARGLKAQGQLTIDLLQDNGFKTYTFDVDQIYLDARNPIYSKLYGIQFKSDGTAKIIAVMDNKIVTSNVKVPVADINNAIIEDIKVRVLPDYTAGMFLSYYNATSNDAMDETTVIVTGNWSKDLSNCALVGELRNGIKVYVEEYNSPEKDKHPASYVFYKNGKVIRKIPFSLKYSYVSNQKSKNMEMPPLTGSFNSVITSRNYYYIRETSLFATQAIQGEKNFAVITWWSRKGSANIRCSVSVFDYKGNLVKKFKDSFLRSKRVFMSQDTSSHYIIMMDKWLKPSGRDKYKVTLHVVDIDTLKEVVIGTSTVDYLSDNSKLTLPFLEEAKVCCNGIAVYSDKVPNYNIVRKKALIHASQLFYFIDFNTKKSYSFKNSDSNRLMNEIYVQDIYMVLSNAIYKVKSSEQGETEKER